MTSLSDKTINNALTRSNSAEIAGFAMPSLHYEDLQTTTGGRFAIEDAIAPANGYVLVVGKLNTVDRQGGIDVASDLPYTDNLLYAVSSKYVNASTNVQVIVPIKKGYHFRILTNSGITWSSIEYCRFFYAE